MRRRLAEAHEAAAANPWEVKLGPGRMMDIELLAQTGALIHDPPALRRPRRMLARLGSARLDRRRRRRRAGRGARAAGDAAADRLRLASDRTIDPAEGGAGLVRLVLAATGQPDLDTLRRRSPPRPPRSAAIIADRLARRPDAADRLPPRLPGAAAPRPPLPDVEVRLPARGAGGAAPAARRPAASSPPPPPRVARAAAVHALPYVERVANQRLTPAEERAIGLPNTAAVARRAFLVRRRHPARRPPRARARARLQHGRRLAPRRPRGRRRLLRPQRRRHRRPGAARRGPGGAGADRRLRRAPGRRHRPHLRRPRRRADALAARRAQLSRAQGRLASRLPAARRPRRPRLPRGARPRARRRPRPSAPVSSSTTPASIRTATTASAASRSPTPACAPATRGSSAGPAAARLPLAGVLGGGYDDEPERLAARHAILFEEGARLRRSTPSNADQPRTPLLRLSLG